MRWQQRLHALMQQQVGELNQQQRRRCVAGLLLCAVLLLWAVPPDDAPTPLPEQLAVAAWGPVGDLNDRADANTIYVTFNRPMVPEELPADTVAGPLRVEPPCAGTFWWTGTTTLAFIPDTGLPLATACTVTVCADSVTASDGKRLENDFTFTFNTPRPRVLACHTQSPADDLGPREQFVLIFSQPVAEAAVQQHLAVFAGAGAGPAKGGGGAAPGAEEEAADETAGAEANDGEAGKPVPGIPAGARPLSGYTCRHPHPAQMQQAWREQNLEPSQVVVVAPSSSWPRDAGLSLRLDRALTGREGALGLHDDFIWSGATTPPLAFRGLYHRLTDHPYDGITLRFTSRVRLSDVARALRLTPDVTVPAWALREERYGQEHTIPLELKPGTEYRVALVPGLRSVHGELLTNPPSLTIRTQDLPPRLSMMSGQVTLRPDQVGRLSATFVNYDAVTLRLAKVTPQQLLELEPVRWQVEREWRTQAPRNETVRLPLPVHEVLPPGARGFVRAQVQGPQAAGRGTDQRELFLQVTSLGITGKFSPVATLLWVTALHGGAGVPDADVVLYARGRGELWRGRTGSDGTVTAPGWRQWFTGDTESRREPELLVIASAGPEQAVLSSAWVGGIESWRFPVQSAYGSGENELRGSVFTDRGIYRPGETVHLKGVLRRTAADGLQVPDGEELDLRITDNTGAKVLATTVTLNRYGGFHLDYPVPATAPVGWYSVYVRPQQDGDDDGDNWYYWDLVGGSFRVAEFRASGIAATVDMPAADGAFGVPVEVLLGGRALAGAPLGGREAAYTARLEAAPPRPAGWDEFSFSPMDLTDWTDDGNSSYMLLTDGTVRLDGQGRARLQPVPPRVGYQSGAEAPANRTDALLTVETTVRDLGEQVTSARASLRIRRSDVQVGVRAVEAFRPEGAAVQGEVILLDRDGNRVADRDIAWQVIRRTWENRQRQTIGGPVWESRKTDEVVATGSVRSGAQPVRFSVTPPSGGYYLLCVTAPDRRGRAISAVTPFYVWGGGGDWWHGNDDRVSVVPDKATYRPGDTARLILRSPFARCRALVTLEREGVVSQRIVDLTGTSPLLEIPVTAAQVPNIYVGIVLINTDPYHREGNPVRLGLINLPVDAAERRLTLNIVPDRAEYLPGGQVTLTVSARDQAGRPAQGELTLAVADEGVLQLVGHRFPDLMESMFAAHRHYVTTADVRTTLVDDRTFGEKGEAAAGDGGDGEEGGAWLRRNFLPTAYWAPALTLDRNGEAKVTFTLPDNITTYRVLALVSGDGNRFGVHNGRQFLARRPLTLEPALPRFVRPGDTFTAGVIVRNLSAPGSDLALTCAVEGLQLQGDADRRVQVRRGRDRLVQWTYVVPADAAGEVVLRFAGLVTGTRQGDAVERRLPVAVPRPEVLAAAAGSSTGGIISERLPLPRQALPGAGGGLEMQFATTALVQLAGATDYLLTYPYGCLEQQASAVAPILALGEAVADLKLGSGFPGGYDGMRTVVREFLAVVPKFQNTDGGFGLWEGGGGYSYPYVTARVVQLLARARAQGYTVEERSYNAACAYLALQVRQKEFAGLPYTASCWYGTHGLSLAALAEAGQVTQADLEPAYRWRRDLPVAGLAALYRAAVVINAEAGMQLQLRRLLLNALRVSPTTAYFAERNPAELAWIYGSDVTATAVALEALLRAPQAFPQAEQVARWLALQRRSGRWNSTYENGVACEALGAYYRRYEAARPNLAAMLDVGGQAAWEGTFVGRSTKVTRAEFPLAALLALPGEQVPLRLGTGGSGRLYYEARIRAVLPPPATGLDRGFAVTRRFETLDGRPVEVSRLRLGETYRLRCTVQNRERRLFVAADFPLPAGCEGIDPDLATERSDLSRHLQPGNWWWRGFSRTEIRDQRVTFFADELLPGRHELLALVRVIAAGTYQWPAARAEAMYEPEVFGRTAAATVRVLP